MNLNDLLGLSFNLYNHTLYYEEHPFEVIDDLHMLILKELRLINITTLQGFLWPVYLFNNSKLLISTLHLEYTLTLK